MTDKDKKWLVIGGGVIAAIVIISLVKGKTDTSGAASDPTGNGSAPATTPFSAAYVSDTLLEAMRYGGTDEDAIINALKNVSPAQFNLVIKDFGKQSYNSIMGNQINYFPLSPLPLEPLKVWLKSELSTSTYNTLRLKYQSLNYL